MVLCDILMKTDEEKELFSISLEKNGLVKHSDMKKREQQL